MAAGALNESTLSILHFNDVYRVTPQKIASGSPDTFDVTQFAWLLDSLKTQWPERTDGAREGLVLFSGDVFSPSMESSVTRGSHMVPVLNQLKIDVSVTGNHDFDFGYPHLSKLVADTTFPWLLSNIIDETTGRVPEALKEFVVLERNGIRVGFVGLVEEDWIATVSSWPSEFKYRSMADTAIDLSKRLRDPEGEYRCDLIIGLTHCRLPNDIRLAKEILAHSPGQQKQASIAEQHGLDLLLGGHDHLYFAPKGVDQWEDYDFLQPVLGAEEDHGEVLIIKSGNDFRDLSEIDLTLQETPIGSVRKKVISRITGKRHQVKGDTPKSVPMFDMLDKLMSSVGSTLKAPVCTSTVMLDVRSYHIRTTESAAGNWFADVIRPAYDDTLYLKGCHGADGVFICAGTLRGDSTYGPGVVTLGDILAILPFEDAIVVIEMDGEALWSALEASLSTWPSQEGRFPVISGFKVTWDSTREPGNRVTEVHLLQEYLTESGSLGHLNSEPIKRERGGRKYKIVTREYMADGHDGYTAMKDCPRLVDEECGSLMSSLVRKYLLGSHFVNKIIRTKAASNGLHPKVQQVLSSEQKESNVKLRWKNALEKVINRQSLSHYRNRLDVPGVDHMSSVDVFDGEKARRGESCPYESRDGQDLLVISPEIDGRLKDQGRSQ
ncbi:flagellar associated protein [Coprinopsis marcescibilis]|uniref:Flagellar associated protein n=1 Tax=Coprinopsis marcescibilis TaxID=230819 RepID=A0A5C3KX12_COPMA|nr:flagellar associated protein [Coprinopsis marcescibilis]